MKKRPKLKTVKKKLWTIFSKYIRLRDRGVCISCGKRDEISKMHAGHYIPKTAGTAIYFDERNVNCQCPGCNTFRHGNLAQYAIALRKKYGKNILEELDEIRRAGRKIKVSEYLELIEKYKAKIEELTQQGL